MNLILDTDIGSEMTDAAALCLAAISPEIQLLGVSTVTHDTVFRASVAKKFLYLLAKDNIPVSAGFGKETQHRWEKQIVFPEGYKPLKLDERQGYELILDLADAHARDVTLVGIGTLTNIAKALEVDPALPEKVSRLVLMGGMIDPPVVDGKKIPIGFEYNFCNDNTGAEKIIRAGFNLTIVPGDLTFQQDDPWTEEEMQELTNIKHPVMQLLADLKNQSLIEMKKGMEKAGLPPEFAKPWVNDELLMAYLIKPELFNTKDIFIKWELPDRYPRITIAESGYPLKLVCNTDFIKARRFIIERLAAIEGI
jgi:inosine-uridine nucleoside N-ribohydrolase